MNKKVQFVVQDAKFPKPTKLSVCTSMTSLGEKLTNRCKETKTLDAITSTTLLSIIIDDACDDDQGIVDITPTVIQVPLDTQCVISSDDVTDISDDTFAMDCEQTHVDSVLNEITKVQDTLTEKMRAAPLIEKEKLRLKSTPVSVTSTKPTLEIPEKIPETIPEKIPEKTPEKIKEKIGVSPPVLPDLNDKPSCETSAMESMELGVTQILGLSSIHVAIKSPEVTEEMGKALMRAHAVLSMDTKVYEGLCIMRAKTPEPAIDMEKELDVITPIDIPPLDVPPIDVPPIVKDEKDEMKDLRGEVLDEEIVDVKPDKIIPVPDVPVAPVEYIPPPPAVPPDKEPLVPDFIKEEEEEEEKKKEIEIKKENEIEKVPPKKYPPKEKPKKPPMKVPTKVPSVKPEVRREPDEVKPDKKAKLKIIDKIDRVSTYVSLLSTTSKISRKSFCPCDLPCHRPRKMCWNDGIEILWPPRITASRCRKNVALCDVHSRKSRCHNSESSNTSFPKLDSKWNVLNQVFYPYMQDPFVNNRNRFRSSIDCQSGGSVNDYAKRKTTCGHSSHSGLCRDNSKHYCQHVNGINTDSRVKQYCHHANNYQTWSDCECYGRNNPSYYWPEQTSYFAYPCMW